MKSMSCRMPGLLLLAAGASLVLGACKKDEEQPKTAAGGELLPRSVGDDMLPYDTVRSQASLSAPDTGLYEEGPARPGRRSVTASEAPQDDVVADPVEPAEPLPETPAE